MRINSYVIICLLLILFSGANLYARIQQQGDSSLMVFNDIRKKWFTWDWETSADGGENWQLQWKINYVRKN